LIFGIGVDTVEIERIKKILGKPNLSKLFSEKEIFYAENKGDSAASMAGCFAAKEAVVKALGTGFNGIAWRDIEVYHNENGQPLVILSGKAKLFADKNQIIKIHLSISHDRTKAVAMAVAEKQVI
jgi:holo-[acyl-carrier protein] synthase